MKLDFDQVIPLTWAVVCSPLWFIDFLVFGLNTVKVRNIYIVNRPLNLEWWTQASRVRMALSCETMVESLASTLCKVLLVSLDSNIPYMVKFIPAWIACVLNAVLCIQLDVRTDGVLLKPQFPFLAILSLKLDKISDFSWRLQFLPIWFLLILIFCCVFMFLINGSLRILPTNRRNALIALSIAALGASVMGIITLMKFSEYLDMKNKEQVSFSMVAIPAVLMQVLCLLGFLVFRIYTKIGIEALNQRQGDECVKRSKNNTVIQFIKSQTTILVRESGNLFRNTSTKILPQDFEETEKKEPIEEDECIICCDDDANNVLFECGHGPFCSSCSTKLAIQNVCPLCRASINVIGKLSNKSLIIGDNRYVMLDQVAILMRNAPETLTEDLEEI